MILLKTCVEALSVILVSTETTQQTLLYKSERVPDYFQVLMNELENYVGAVYMAYHLPPQLFCYCCSFCTHYCKEGQEVRRSGPVHPGLGFMLPIKGVPLVGSAEP